MANINAYKIEGSTTYVSLNNQISFQDGKKYKIQVSSRCKICEKSTRPDENEGFYVKENEIMNFVKGSAELYIKSSDDLIVNIAEE